MLILDHKALKREADANGISYNEKEAAVYDHIFSLTVLEYEQGRKKQPFDIFPYKEQ